MRSDSVSHQLPLPPPHREDTVLRGCSGSFWNSGCGVIDLPASKQSYIRLWICLDVGGPDLWGSQTANIQLQPMEKKCVNDLVNKAGLSQLLAPPHSCPPLPEAKWNQALLLALPGLDWVAADPKAVGTGLG